jgi:hypothetical protein
MQECDDVQVVRVNIYFKPCTDVGFYFNIIFI